MDRSAADAAPRVLCLCAAWCQLCTAYAAVFGETARRLRADWPELASRWIDIEDEADLVGDLDVETFPTLVVLRDTQVLFHGPLPPQADVLERVVRSVLESAVAAADDPPPEAVLAFAHRVAAAGF